VTRAVELLGLSVILDHWENELEGHGLSVALRSSIGRAEELLTLVLAIVLIMGIARWRNWARILFLISNVWVDFGVSYALGTVGRVTFFAGLEPDRPRDPLTRDGVSHFHRTGSVLVQAPEGTMTMTGGSLLGPDRVRGYTRPRRRR